jgi:dephospho-CoA kinase
VPIVIGLTGNIACGKSTVGKIFQKLGVPVLDSDDVVHSIYENDEAVQAELVKEFGSYQRADIAKQVFGKDKKEKRKILESILHPKVDSIFRDWVRDNQEQAFLVNLVPLLFEAKLEHRYDRIITVKATRDDQILRLKKRNPELSDEEIEKRIESQMSLEEKLRKSDFVVDNSSNLDDLDIQIEEILEQISSKENIDFQIKSSKSL